MTIHISNVGCHVSGADLYQLFAAIGNVASARIITNKETGKSLRYGFVEMPGERCGNEAISKLHGKVLSRSASPEHAEHPVKVQSSFARVRRLV